MQTYYSFGLLFIRLWRQLSPRRKRQLFAILVTMVLASFSEVVSVGAVLPLLGMLTALERVFENKLLQPMMQLLDVRSPDQFCSPRR